MPGTGALSMVQPSGHRDDGPGTEGTARTLLIAIGALLLAGAAAAQTPEPAVPEPAPEAPAAVQPAATPDDEPDPEPETIVHLTDGRRVSGNLVESDAERIIIRIGGIKSTFAMDIVDRVQVLPPVEERYRKMRAAIDDNDVEQLLQLVEWLRFRKRYKLAGREIDHVLSIAPDRPDARRLRLLIDAQQELIQKAGVRQPADPQVQPDKPAAGAPAQFPGLTPAQINLIKVYEIDLRDPPKMIIPRDAITKLMERHPGDALIPATEDGRNAMYRKPPEEILNIMFRLQERELYGEVKVIGHPQSMIRFRDAVHRPWIVNACATSRCHGGTEAGRLYLDNQRANTEEAVYTNFLIMDRFKLADGTPLINYDEPQRSPLLQIGLPRRDSLYPHPEVPGTSGKGDVWKPFFRSTEDRRYVQAVEWIKMMYRPRPNYPIDYSPPHPSEPPAQPESPPPTDPGR